jgi:hypothetical protein
MVLQREPERGGLCPAKRCPLWSLRLRSKDLPDRATLLEDATPLYPLERPLSLGMRAPMAM